MGLEQPPQAGADLCFQWDHPVRQFQAVIQKRHLLPGQVRYLVPGKALLPGQAEHHALRAGRLGLQDPAHGGLVRPVHHIFPHGGLLIVTIA